MTTTKRVFYHGVVPFLVLALVQRFTSMFFFPHPNSRLLKDNTSLFSHLRFLAFGTSRAWGSGLRNRYLAYPFLISPNVTNLAIRATGCEYPSLCTMSMVQSDQSYDVILIEYNHVSIDEEGQNYRRLATRLRHRFPRATIIFIYAWSPFDYVFTTSCVANGGIRQSTAKTAYEVRLEMFPTSRSLRLIHLDQMWSSIVAAINQTRVTTEESSSVCSTSTWRRRVNPKNLAWIQETAQIVDGHVWELPYLPDATANLEAHGKWFLPDCTHYSVEGHQVIQQGIFQLLSSLMREPALPPSHTFEDERQQLSPRTLSRSDVVGPWKGWDQCASWFESGYLGGTSSTLNFLTNMTMVEFSKGKFALEAPGTLTLTVEKSCALYINYMAGGPLQIYPKTRITMMTSSEIRSVEVIPVGKTNVKGKNAVHIAQIIPIGFVEAGNVELEFIPMEKHQNPFRIVGVIASNERAIGSLPELMNSTSEDL